MRACSYQTARPSWKHDVARRVGRVLAAGFVAAVSVVALVAATPYRDTRGRFRLEIADRWALAPGFGDTYGMVFRRPLRRPGTFATLTVHVDPVSAGSLRGFADEIERSGSARRRGKERKQKIAGRSALVREYRTAASDKRPEPGRARSYFLQAAGQFFHLRAEAPRNELRLVEDDLRWMLARFEPARIEPDAASEAARHRAPPPWVGRWRSDAGVAFLLGSDGRFALGGAEGTYNVSGRSLTLELPGGATRRFAIEIDGARLVLTSPELGAPAVYRRAGTTAAAPGRRAGSATIAGRWETRSGVKPVVLDLGGDGRFSMGGLTGTWEAAPGRLTMRGGPGQSVTYRYTVDGTKLTLSGGDLDDPVDFQKIAGP